jgi:hypothetical protein
MTQNEPSFPIPCRNCHQLVPESEETCPECNLPRDLRVPWYHGFVGICILLFLVLGPIAIPLLWRSPILSKPVKVRLTVATVAYSLWILYSLAKTYSAMMEALSIN